MIWDYPIIGYQNYLKGTEAIFTGVLPLMGYNCVSTPCGKSQSENPS